VALQDWVAGLLVVTPPGAFQHWVAKRLHRLAAGTVDRQRLSPLETLLGNVPRLADHWG